MGLDCICSILAQTPMALLVIEKQIGSPQAIHLHVLQLPKDWVTLQYVHYHSHIPGECGRAQPIRAVVTSSIMVYFSTGDSSILPQHLPVHRTAPAWKISGCHPAACIPLVCLGIHLSRVLAPVRVYHRHTKAISSNL